MYRYGLGTRQTNGATANFGVGVFSSAATSVPVATVSGNVLVSPSGLIHNFSQQAHSIGAASGFAPAAQFASPMVSAHDSLGSNSFRLNAFSRSPGALYAPSANGI